MTTDITLPGRPVRGVRPTAAGCDWCGSTRRNDCHQALDREPTFGYADKLTGGRWIGGLIKHWEPDPPVRVGDVSHHEPMTQETP